MKTKEFIIFPKSAKELEGKGSNFPTFNVLVSNPEGSQYKYTRIGVGWKKKSKNGMSFISVQLNEEFVSEAGNRFPGFTIHEDKAGAESSGEQASEDQQTDPTEISPDDIDW